MRRIIYQQKQYLGCISDSRGASGGIVTIWDNSKWKYTSTNLHQNWIRTALDSRTGNHTVIIYNVYVPNHYREKEICWDDLKTSIDGELNSNIIVAGDFNLVLHANKKRGGCFTPNPFRGRLEAITQEHELVDVVPKNRRYTWSTRRIGISNIMERLDRFLVNISYLSSFSVGCTKVLNTSDSGHYPITLTLETHCPLESIPFKYIPLWNWIPAVREIVQKTWSHHVEGSPGFIWETKLKRTKQQNKEQEHALYTQLSHINREEETKWRLKSRQLWLQGGDKNTAYFHKQATARKLRNNVSSILDNEGNLHSTQETIRKAVSEHYRDL
eukprot:PITA_34390